MVGTPELTHEGFFSPDMPQEQVNTHFARIQEESFRAALDVALLDLPRPKRVITPMLVLGAANDRIFTVSEIEKTARAYHTDAEIFPDMAHDMMLDSGWEAVADRIIAWLDEREL
jgi:alpha-beta hydrolase superfamily lysophospholipase